MSPSDPTPATPLRQSPLQRFLSFSRKNPYLVLGPAAFVLGFYLLAELGQRQPAVDVISPIENILTDLRFRAREKHDTPASENLVLIGIDENSLRAYGAWPWKRMVHGNLLRVLAAAEPAVVAFDLLFTEPSQDPAMDEAFAVGLDKGPPAVLGAVSDSTAKNLTTEPPERLLPSLPLTKIVGDRERIKTSHYANYPIPQLRERSTIGFVDSDPDGIDGVRRKLPLVVRVGDHVWPSLVTQSLIQYYGITPDDVTVHLGRHIEFNTPKGAVRAPITDRGEIWVNYRNQDSYKGLGVSAAITLLFKHFTQDAPLPEGFPKLEGSLLLVGQLATGLSDFGPSPLNKLTPLVLVHANAINSIFRQDFLIIPANGWFLVAWLLIAYAVIIGLRDASPLAAVGVPVIVIVAYVAGAFAVFWFKSIQIPIFWPAFSFFLANVGAVILRWLQEQKSKQAIKSVFASYISPGVMNTLLRNPDAVQLGGQRKPVTIFFSDIRGFTSFSEGANEVELVRQLNEYFEKMVGCVARYDGTLHKYIGDAIMAVWGDVVTKDEPTDAKAAVRCSLAMKKELVELNKFWKADGRMELKIGIGLNNGPVCVGNIGASQRKEFTVIGDAVNTASRLEGVTKQFHTDFCIGESVQRLLEGEFLTRTLGLLIVKGKTKPLRVYEVLDDLKGIEPMNFFSHEWGRRYERAFEHYLAREFDQAVSLFQQCLQEKPDDFLTDAYLKECLEYQQHPPGPDWNGVIKLDSK